MVPPRPASTFDATSLTDQAWIDSKTTPHPFACFAQCIRLTGRFTEVPKRVYVYAEGGICEGMYDPYRGSPGSTVIAVEQSGHSIMVDQPAKVAEILNDACAT
jgi:hypothetical protein